MTDGQSNSPDVVFTPAELEYIQSQRLARIATVGANGQPHVTPVAFHYDPQTHQIYVGGHGDFTTRKKWHDVQENPQVALVIDDIASVNPWKVRGIEIRGTAEPVLTGGQQINPTFGPAMLRITPRRVVGWGLDTEIYTPPNSRSVNVG